MCERCKVTARTERSLGRNERRHARVQHVDKRLRDERAHAGMAARQHIGTDGHHGAHDLLGQRFAHPNHAQDDEVARELSGFRSADLAAGERAESGVDAVDHSSLPLDRIDHPLVAGVHARSRGLTQGCDRCVVTGYRDQLLDRKASAVQFDHLDLISDDV